MTSTNNNINTDRLNNNDKEVDLHGIHYTDLPLSIHQCNYCGIEYKLRNKR